MTPSDLSTIAPRLLAVRLDALTAVMLPLVGLLAVVIARYSRVYLRADPGRGRYARALAATLGAVALLVVTGNLLVIALAWTAASLALHALLTHFPDRPQALVAAHKKFILSRLADACVLGTVALVGRAVGRLDLDAIDAFARAHDRLPPSLEAAAVLLAVGVALKSAQLPFHGWLTQVMEAPTPVSALLHAGVVNVGGFVLIRLAPLMSRAPVAQTLLVAAGTVTAVVASLVMTTRVSVKVALAWSTCAQLGFMLVECGLGAWHLALLHLVAHSLYKAHAFLRAGSAVDAWRARDLAPDAPPISTLETVAAAAVALAGVSAALYGGSPVAALLGLSLAPLVARGGGWRALAVAALYAGGHVAFGRLLALPRAPAPPTAAVVIALGGFALLFVAQAALLARPRGALARTLQPHLFAGLYLDERFTRLTFRLWPPRRPPTPAPSAPWHLAPTQET